MNMSVLVQNALQAMSELFLCSNELLLLVGGIKNLVLHLNLYTADSWQSNLVM